MKATLTSISAKSGTPAEIDFEIDVKNDDANHNYWILAWTGQVRLGDITLGSLETKFAQCTLQPHQSYSVHLSWGIPHDCLSRIEEERNGKDLLLNVELNFLSAFFSKSESTQGLDLMQRLTGMTINVESSSGSQFRIPKSDWESKLETLGYGRVEYLEFYLPPPPVGTSLDKALDHINDAKKKFNSGDYPDVLTACRKALEELQKLAGKEEQRKSFVTQMLGDEEKAKDFSALLDVVGKAQAFGSGGPHTYWVKTASRRDAEFALRITVAVIAYFAKNLAKASEQTK